MKYDKDKIFPIFQECWQDSEQPVEVTDGYSFDYLATINKIELYRNSRFQSGDVDSEGNKKYFFNIVNPQAGNATKNIDLDTKDITIRAVDGKDKIKALLYRQELISWLRKNEFAELLNEISEQLPVYGHLVFEKTPDGEIERVRLSDWRRDWGVDDLDDSPYCIRRYYMQPHELKKMKGWDTESVNKVIQSYYENKDKNICVYKVYADYPAEVFGGTEGEYMRGYFYCATNQDDYFVGNDYKGFQEVLYGKPVKDNKWPFKELKYITIDGRGMGVGVIELGFDAQQRWNEMANQKAKSMQLSSKHVYQTRDETVQKNITSDVLDGEIIKVRSEITPLATEERNLASYQQEEGNVLSVLRNLTNAQEIVTGENLPSGTPYRLGALLNQNAVKLFEFIRENIGIFLECLITDWVLPQFTPKALKEHLLEITDNSLLEKVFEWDVNARINEGIKKYVLKTGNYPPRSTVDAMKSVMMAQRDETEFINIPDNFFDFEKDIEVVITDEKFNFAQRIETVNNLLQLLAQNPQIVQLPETKKLFEQLLEDVGVSPLLITSNSTNQQMPTGNPAPMMTGVGSQGATPPMASNPMA